MTHGEFAARLSADEQALYHRRRAIHLNVGPLDASLPMCRKGYYSPTSLYTTEVAAVTCPACQRHLQDARENVAKSVALIRSIVPDLMPKGAA